MVIGSFGSMLSLIGAFFCTIFYEWKRNSPVATQDSLQNVYHAEGLWMRCAIPVPGRMSCDYYGTTLFDVPGYLQALRALSVISCILLFCSTLCNILALDCITQVAGRKKAWLARIGGASCLLGGLMLITAVSWYAAEVIQEFNNKFAYPEETFKYTFGAALYVGWFAGGLAFICGAVVLCFSCCSDFEDDDGATYTYKPPKSRTNEEYV